MTKDGAAHGIVVCTGGFTQAAEEFVVGAPITLVDLDGILKLAAKADTSNGWSFIGFQQTNTINPKSTTISAAKAIPNYALK